MTVDDWLMPIIYHTTFFHDTVHFDCRHSQFSKFPALSLFAFCAAINKPDFRQIAEASQNPLWLLYLALYLATPLYVFSV
jgi:hypothetical protein